MPTGTPTKTERMLYPQKCYLPFTEDGLRDYLTLLSIHQTCVYKGVSFLKFLVSQERDIDRFCEASRRTHEGLPYDLNPEGFIPPRRRRKTQPKGTTPTDDPASNGSIL